MLWSKCCIFFDVLSWQYDWNIALLWRANVLLALMPWCLDWLTSGSLLESQSVVVFRWSFGFYEFWFVWLWKQEDIFWEYLHRPFLHYSTYTWLLPLEKEDKYKHAIHHASIRNNRPGINFCCNTYSTREIP